MTAKIPRSLQCRRLFQDRIPAAITARNGMIAAPRFE
jgi:hypothetical protein